MNSDRLRGFPWATPLALLTLLFVCAATPAPGEAACAPETPIPIRSGTGENGIPVVFSFRSEAIEASLFPARCGR